LLQTAFVDAKPAQFVFIVNRLRDQFESVLPPQMPAVFTIQSDSPEKQWYDCTGKTSPHSVELEYDTPLTSSG
jgi:hypothetical protein